MSNLITYDAEPAWLASRHKLGNMTASLAAGVCGIPYGCRNRDPSKPIIHDSVYTIWTWCTGKVPWPDFANNEQVEAGKRCERVVLDWYADKTGRMLADLPPYSMYWHPEFPWLGCTPDAMVIDAAGKLDASVPPVANVEAKNVGFWQTQHWLDEDGYFSPPLAYQFQTMLAGWIAGVDTCSLTALIGGQKHDWRDYPTEIPDVYIEKLCKFRDCVLGDIEPDVDDSESTAETLKLLFPEHKPKTYVFLGDGLRTIADELAAVEAKIADLKVEERGYKNRIKRALGDNEYGRFDDGSGFSFKMQVRKAHAVKESRSRPLRWIKEVPTKLLTELTMTLAEEEK